MRKYLFKSLYRAVSFLSDFIDNRYLKKCKIFLGTSLLILTTACQSQKKDNTENRMCYASLPMPEDTIEQQTTDSSTVSTAQISAHIPDTESDPGIMCYASRLAEEDTFILSKPSIEPEEELITCYEPPCYVEIVKPFPDDTIVIDNDTAVYIIVEEMPEFPDGIDSMMRYIDRNFRYPSGDICASGRVIVSLIVEKDGSISEPKVVRSVDVYFDREALRVVRGMPKWKPGKQNGREVRVKYTLPVRFKL